MTGLLVMAKAPVAGQVKTRLCPPLTPLEAAQLAAAALIDTLYSCSATGLATTVAMHGDLDDAELSVPLRAALANAQVIPQRGNTFAQRLVAAHADAGREGPVLQIGMDTPQLTAVQLSAAVHTLGRPGVDAVLGPAADGGWWTLGLRSGADARVLHAVPMSQDDTGTRTLEALRSLGLRVALLPTLTDVDAFPDAVRVGRQAPTTRFASHVRQLLADNRSRSACQP
ncbi:rSAM/selenodomain-associated transferase 1 [Nakamurella sp. UYEF19]|uniref:TIGR04282 family arsenosugar biosynthesis glycosyltransferase n=1 Tax=Nakamurella sp. UYEF19 TaxID=1756392 RepID=UPI003398DF8F